MWKNLLICYCALIVSLSFAYATDDAEIILSGTCVHVKGSNCSDDRICYSRLRRIEGVNVEMVGCYSEMAEEEQKICKAGLTDRGYWDKQYDSKRNLDYWGYSSSKYTRGTNRSNVHCCVPALGGTECNREEMSSQDNGSLFPWGIVFSLVIAIGLIACIQKQSMHNPSTIIAGKELLVKSVEGFCGLLTISFTIAAWVCFWMPIQIDCFKSHPEGYYRNTEKLLIDVYLSHAGESWEVAVIGMILGMFLLVVPLLEMYRVVAIIVFGFINRRAVAITCVVFAWIVGIPGCFYFADTFSLAADDAENEFCRVGGRMWQIVLFPIASMLYALICFVREGLTCCSYEVEERIPPIIVEPQCQPAVVVYRVHQPMYPVHPIHPAHNQQVVHPREDHVSPKSQFTDHHTPKGEETTTDKSKVEPSTKSASSVKSEITQVEKSEKITRIN